MTKTSEATVLDQPVLTRARAVRILKVVDPAPSRRRLLSWSLALSTLALASVSVVMLAAAPTALPFALVAAALALTARGLLTIIRSESGARGRAKTHAAEAAQVSAATRPATGVANAGLGIAIITLIPLLAFALLWTSIMVILGVSWLLYTLGLM